MNPRIIGRTIAALLAVLAGFGSATTTTLAEDPQVKQVTAKTLAERQRQARAARQAVGELDLSRRQALLLLPIVEKAAELHIQAYEQEAELLPEMIEAFQEFAHEDSLNQGFSRKVERRTSQINKQAKETRKHITEQLIALEEQAASVLTRSQRELAEYIQPVRGRARHKGHRAKIDRLTTAKQELKAWRQRIHPQLDKLGRHLLHPAAAEALGEIARKHLSKTTQLRIYEYTQGTASHPIARFDQQKAEVKRLRAEINHWNLINGLHLTSRQIEQIVTLYNTAANANPASKSRKSRPPRQSLVALEREVEKILNPGQLQVLADYKACLIPPKNLKDPVRIGQGSDYSRLEKWLSRARKAPDDKLLKLVDQRLQKEAERFGGLTRSEYQNRRALLLKSARQAAEMSDVDFELNKPELAEEIARRDRGKELKSEIARLAHERGLPGSVAQFMLKPLFIEQLQQRGRQLAKGCVHRQSDLTKGPQADNCEKGCAINKKKK